MTGVVHITIPFAAIGKGRPRVYRGIATTPAKTRAYERQVAQIAAAAMRGRPLLDGPVRILLEIDVEVPESWPKYRRADALAGLIWPTVKPDIDNTEKALLDAMNGVVYRDDSQIVVVQKSKHYATSPQVRIVIDELRGKTAQQATSSKRRKS
ncbi:RusA family crossover junction endodeoxyribonuclease [Burkholderia anthina]|uniref:RusA family crossover junction endodeoxyribonuclease n=1 Tax=Burkholderia anthina TaxID=179879 RepID=UPI001AA01D1D|nr:RusA family crossover junction endodeoxyribonuclease [Burkholderia anthina]QTD88782.1 RusA family crossover junction endodeoxyribonuclease [Burkholderia anthina]